MAGQGSDSPAPLPLHCLLSESRPLLSYRALRKLARFRMLSLIRSSKTKNWRGGRAESGRPRSRDSRCCRTRRSERVINPQRAWQRTKRTPHGRVKGLNGMEAGRARASPNGREFEAASADCFGTENVPNAMLFLHVARGVFKVKHDRRDCWKRCRGNLGRARRLSRPL